MYINKTITYSVPLEVYKFENLPNQYNTCIPYLDDLVYVDGYDYDTEYNHYCIMMDLPSEISKEQWVNSLITPEIVNNLDIPTHNNFRYMDHLYIALLTTIFIVAIVGIVTA